MLRQPRACAPRAQCDPQSALVESGRALAVVCVAGCTLWRRMLL